MILINKQWIEAFICVSKTQNVSKAAEILFLTQPSVTNRIQALENEIKEQLFTRSNRKMILTDAGNVFLPFALNILNNWNNGIKNIHQLREKVIGTLTIAIFYSALPQFTPYIISFAKKYPLINLSIKTRHSEEVGELVLNYIAHVGIVRTIKNDSLVSKTVIKDDFILAVYPDHRLVTCKNIKLEDLKDEKLVFLYSGGIDREIIENYFWNHEIQPNIIMETESIVLCKQIILEKMGISFLPRFSIQEEIKNNSLIALDTLSISTNLSRNVDLIWLKKNYDNHLAELFVQHIVNSFPNPS